MGGVFRKLFKRKGIKSQIGRPMSIRREPTAFNTGASERESQFKRSTSLPAVQLFRNLVPSPPTPFGTEEPTIGVTFRDVAYGPARPRHSSLPDVLLSNPDHSTNNNTQATSFFYDVDNEYIDLSKIGSAITSPSSPRRRSQSASGLYDLHGGHRHSPLRIPDERPSRHEIRSWSDGVGNIAELSDLDTNSTSNEPAATRDSLDVQMIPPVLGADKALRQDVEQTPQKNYSSFDFGTFAAAIHEQEDIATAERMVTVEVKLMDLEYAISKLQARIPPETRAVDEHVMGTESRKASPATTYVQTMAAEGPESRQELVGRSNSNATTVHGSEGRGASSSRPQEKRISITSLTIDHYTTLIGLIRREQAARRSLEGQLAELREEVLALRPLAHSPAARPYRTYEEAQQLRSVEGWAQIEDYRAGKKLSACGGVGPDDVEGIYKAPKEMGFDAGLGMLPGLVSREVF